MKKFFILGVFLTCALIIGPFIIGDDWSRYDTGYGNIRLDGYKSQPGYVAFTDGNGTIIGYLWAHAATGRLYWSKKDPALTENDVDLTLERLDEVGGGNPVDP